MATHYIPQGSRAVTPHMILMDAASAIDLYKGIFGARELSRMTMPGDGKIMHAVIEIGDSRIMIADDCSDEAHPNILGNTTLVLHLYVPDVDAAFGKAVNAGCTPLMPPANMFWGDRYCKILDPFDQEWSLATHIEDVPMEDLARRAAESFKQPPSA